jgi:hypothetical protein
MRTSVLCFGPEDVEESRRMFDLVSYADLKAIPRASTSG